MSILRWRPTQCGGINLDDDLASVPAHQLRQCDNYVPYRRRWKLIEGNSTFVSSANAVRTRHLVDFIEDSAGSNLFRLIRMNSNGTVDNISSGTAASVSTPTISSSETMLWDTSNFRGTLLLANGSNNLLEMTTVAGGMSQVSGSPPTIPRYVEAWKGRIFISRAAEPWSFNYSAVDDRTTWTGNDAGTEIITPVQGDVITALRSVENYLAIFTNLSVTAYLGDHPEDWVARTIFEDHGCSSHRTIARINGGLIYANDFGVFLLYAAMKRMELTRDIRTYWQNLSASSTQRNKSRSAYMHAVYDPNPDTNRYYIFVSEGTSTAENVCWIFNFNSGEWSRMVSFMDAGQTCQAAVTYESSAGTRLVYFATGTNDNTTSDKKVYRIDGSAGFASRTGSDIAGTIQTGIISGIDTSVQNAEPEVTTKRFDDFIAIFVPTTTASQVVSFTWEGCSVDAKATQRTADQSITSSTADVTRPRVPVSTLGWGLIMTMTYTGTAAHSFGGGHFAYTDVGVV